MLWKTTEDTELRRGLLSRVALAVTESIVRDHPFSGVVFEQNQVFGTLRSTRWCIDRPDQHGNPGYTRGAFQVGGRRNSDLGMAVLNFAEMGAMAAATVHGARALAVVDDEDAVGFEALGVLAPQAARANTVNATAVRTSGRTLGSGLIGGSPYTERSLRALATQAALRPDRSRSDRVEFPHR